MGNKMITIKELSVLVWLKVLDDFEAKNEFDEEVTSLNEKIDMLDLNSFNGKKTLLDRKDANMESEFFEETFYKLLECGFLEERDGETYLTKVGEKTALAILNVEKVVNKIKITAHTEIEKIEKFIEDNREEIYKTLILILSTIQVNINL